MAVSLAVWILGASPVFLLNWILYIYRSYAGRWDLSGTTNRNRTPMRTTRAFLIPIAAFLGVCLLSTSRAREEVRRKISSLGPDCKVSMNGAAVQNRGEVLGSLRDLHWERGHHSYPTKRLSLVISSESGRAVFELARDSEYPQEYWVFLPEYWITSKTEIGRIKTHVFDAY